jgi:ParB-like chromosome segregation protein Spo0J
VTEPLKFHPLADMFPLMKGEEFDALVADIKAHGLREPIMLHEDKVLDGRNRYRACLALGIEVDVIDDCDFSEADARAYVISQNLYRRHLTPEVRRAKLVELVAAAPEKSDRSHARELGVDHKLIGRMRRKGESTGAIDPVEKRKGADGKKRRKPAARKKRLSGRALIEEQGWRDAWLGEGRSLKDYKAGIKDQNSEVWKWRRGEVSFKRETGAGGSASSGSFERWQAEAAAAARAAPVTEPERSEILATDARYARDLVAHDFDLACGFLHLLSDDERRAAFMEALGTALMAADKPEIAGSADGNDQDPATSAEETSGEWQIKIKKYVEGWFWTATATDKNKEALHSGPVATREEAENNARAAIERAGQKQPAAAIAEEEEEEEDEQPRRRRGKAKEVETTLEHAVHDAFEDLYGLGGDCRDVVDSAPPGLDQTQRISTLDDTASELENLQEPEVPSELEELPVKYRLGRVRSRADRCGAAVGIIEACIEALATVAEGDERHASARALSDELDDAMSATNECSFPGMYG